MKPLKKGMAAVAFALGSLTLADLSSAEPITGFNGFDWGVRFQTVEPLC